MNPAPGVNADKTGFKKLDLSLYVTIVKDLKPLYRMASSPSPAFLRSLLTFFLSRKFLSLLRVAVMYFSLSPYKWVLHLPSFFLYFRIGYVQSETQVFQELLQRLCGQSLTLFLFLQGALAYPPSRSWIPLSAWRLLYLNLLFLVRLLFLPSLTFYQFAIS